MIKIPSARGLIAISPVLALSFLSIGAEPPPSPETLEKRFQRVLPGESEEAWRAVGWHTNLMQAREIALEQERPVFLWIMVGNPHGCT